MYTLPINFKMYAGDSTSYSIAAASVIAKVHRDRIMMKLHEEFPQYNFKQHKGDTLFMYANIEYKGF